MDIKWTGARHLEAQVLFKDSPSSALLACALLAAVILYLWLGRSSDESPMQGIPVVRPTWTRDVTTVLREANEKYHDRAYLLMAKDPTVIIPTSCIEPLKNLPDSVLSTNGSQYDRFAIEYTHSGLVDPELAFSVKYDLAGQVDSMLPGIWGEVQSTVADFFPTANDGWKPVDIQPALTEVVTATLGRMIVGLPLSRDPKWRAAAIGHANSVVFFAMQLKMVPEMLRRFFAPLLPIKRKVHSSSKGITDMISPYIEKELDLLRSKGGDPAAYQQQPVREGGQLVQWLVRRYKPDINGKFDNFAIIKDHYSLCFAAIHGPTFLLMQSLIDFASYPKYAARIREEADRVATADKLDRAKVAEMTFTDAFCKESSRMNPQGVVAWLRKTHRDIVLATGQVVPANTLISSTNPFFNPAAHPHIQNPNTFDPERWLRKRADAGPGEQPEFPNYAFGGAYTDSLIFGYGKKACPGRPFGIAQVKLVLAEIARKYDVRLADGLTERPANIIFDAYNLPPIAPFGKVRLEFKLR